jgi:hypothetical protein
MSFRALLNYNDKNEISAEKAFYQYGKKRIYFCPDRNCKAKMILKSYDGESIHYFAALKNEHIEGCTIAKYGITKSEFNESSFDFESFYTSISTIQKNTNNCKGRICAENRNNQVILKQIRTVRQLYCLCYSSTIGDTYNNIKIEDILYDERTCYFSSKQLSGIRLVKCKSYKYDSTEQIFYFNTYNKLNWRFRLSCGKRHKIKPA